MTTGVDIVNVSRISKILLEKKDSFYKKIMTDKEIDYICSRNHNPKTIAGIFAAKEAISKTLGTGIGAIGWKDMEILHDDKGKPYVNFSDKGKKIIEELMLNVIEISITHEEEYAIAFAIGYGKQDESIVVDPYIKKLLPKRKRDSHKGNYGRVGIIGGSKGMTGAPYLATQAALRSGSGLVYTLVPKSLENIMAVKLTEAIIKPIEDENKGFFTLKSIEDIKKEIKSMDVLAIGPGFGVDIERAQLLREILNYFKGPIVLDADGINCIALDPSTLANREGITIMTPHPGELANFLKKTTKEIQGDRINYSKYVSEKYNVIMVLKGVNTIITGKGEIFLNPTGNPGMATAGSGDILTGIIASFIGQGLNSFKGAVLGVYCHGLAGDIAKLDKGEYGLIATDILENIPYSIKKIEE
jgi:NAD(P)H-hydrate epimerase